MSAAASESRFTLTPLKIPGVVAIQRQRLSDERGSLSRVFCAEELAVAGWQWPVVQINYTCTAKSGTVRGMHYQRQPQAEAKLVSCMRGKVCDVVVDMRTGSRSFLQWCSHELSADNLTALLIPPGCAHGFQALTDDVELLYLHSASYSPEAEIGVRPTDPQLGISWPLPISIMSPRDAMHPLLDSKTADFKALDGGHE